MLAHLYRVFLQINKRFARFFRFWQKTKGC
jgi:hypothetical protein